MLTAPYLSHVSEGYRDPFHSFLNLVQKLGKGQVFLLDSVVDDAHPDHRLSILGALPILEVSVKDGVVTVAAVAGLFEYLVSALQRAGCVARDSGASTRPTQTVVQGSTASYEDVEPMQMLEHIRVAVKDLLPEHHDVPFSNGLLGYLGYDAVHYLERLPKTTVDDRELPDVRLQWHLVTIHIQQQDLSVFDALSALAQVVSPAALRDWNEQCQTVLGCLNEPMDVDPLAEVAATMQDDEVGLLPVEIQDDVSLDEFVQRVNQAKSYIVSGDIFQIVLSKRLRIPKSMHPYVVYDRLRKINPSPYMFMAEYPDMRLFGASPEVQFRSLHGIAEMKPIAGTSKGRGATEAEDALLAKRLLEDEKERAEHVMLVDLCRNDLGRVCRSGSIEVPQFMAVEAYSHLFHLVSSVQGRLREGVSVFHALLATFPAGTLSGAPKIRAMEIIDELESLRRGPYGGLVGMVDFEGNANTAIVIRTIVDTGGMYYVQVGAGIVADSDPMQEWLECGHKSGALVQVLTSP